MNKVEFLRELRSQIKGYKKEEINNSISYYEEMIEDRMEDGMSEEEAIASCGSIEDIVAQIAQEYAENNSTKKRHTAPIVVAIIVAALIIAGGIVAITINNKKSDNDNSAVNSEMQVVVDESGRTTTNEVAFDIKGDDGVKKIVSDLYVYKVTYTTSKDSKIHIKYTDRSNSPLYKITNDNGTLNIGTIKSYTSNCGTAEKDEIKFIQLEKLSFSIEIPEKYTGAFDLGIISGSLVMENITTNEDMDISVTSGTAEINGLNIDGDLSANCISGTLIAKKVDCSNKIEVNITSGSGELALAGSKNDYKITSSVLAGSSNLPKSTSKGDRRLDASVISGSLDVSFDK